MKDRQKIFLDRVINLILDNTIINYDRREITYPFIPRYSNNYPTFKFPFIPRSEFYNYIIDTYGLTEEESDIVFYGYNKLLKDKLDDER